MSDIRAQEQQNPSENSFDKHMKSCFWTLLQKRFQKTRWKCWCVSGCKIRTPCFGKKMEHNIRIKKAWSLKRMFNNTNKVIRKDYCILSHYSSNWILIRMMWLVSRWGTLLPPGTVCSMATVRNSRLPGESQRGRWVGDIWKCTSEWSRETFKKVRWRKVKRSRWLRGRKVLRQIFSKICHLKHRFFRWETRLFDRIIWSFSLDIPDNISTL